MEKRGLLPKAIVEALLVASPEPLSPAQVSEILEINVGQVRGIISRLQEEYQQGHRGMDIVEVAEGYQLCTPPAFAVYVDQLDSVNRPSRLTQASLETLAVVAYRQPVTRAEIEAVRGVKVDGVVRNLLERSLIEEVGRKDTLGRPILYGTTRFFLQHFGLRDLSDLPPLAEFLPEGVDLPDGEDILLELHPITADEDGGGEDTGNEQGIEG